MQTEPIRWVCGVCLKVRRCSLTAYQYWASPFGPKRANTAMIRVYLPQCCDQDMLIAGEPKKDVHGLRERGAIIDPVDNLKLMVVT